MRAVWTVLAVLGGVAIFGFTILQSRPAPTPVTAELTPKTERPGPVTWSDATGAFSFAGKPMRAAKLWSFDGSTEGFTSKGSEVSFVEPAGLELKVADPILRSPSGLAVDGSLYSTVLIRLTRVKAGAGWNGALYYSNPVHGETGAFFGKPVAGGDPAVGETVTLVYDMGHQAVGAGDWPISLVDQIRLDMENGPGAEFVIHQVAIAEKANLTPALAPTTTTVTSTRSSDAPKS